MHIMLDTCAKKNLNWCRPGLLLETVKQSPNPETGLVNRGPLEALNDTKLILNDLSGSLSDAH